MKSRYLKAECRRCGYSVRVTRVHLRSSGPPLCPSDGCHALPLGSPDWESMFADELEGWEADAMAIPYRKLRETERTARTEKPCANHCAYGIRIGERYLETVYTVDGALHHERHCQACILNAGSHAGTRSRAGGNSH